MTNDQVAEMISDLREAVAGIQASSNATHEQTKKTNGAVADLYTKHEYTNARVDSLCEWRSFVTGGLAILSIIVVPLAIYITAQWIAG